MGIERYLEKSAEFNAQADDLVYVVDADDFPQSIDKGLPAVRLLRDDSDHEVCIIASTDEVKEVLRWKGLREQMKELVTECGTHDLRASIEMGKLMRIDFSVTATAVAEKHGRVYILAKGLNQLGKMVEDLERQINEREAEMRRRPFYKRIGQFIKELIVSPKSE